MSVQVAPNRGFVRHSASSADETRNAVRVLVVDDSPQFLEVVCVLLELEDRVDVVGRANDGAEAIRAVAALRPDLVLMDVQMPTMNGITAALIISTCFPSTKVVLMSADESPELREQSRRCGARAFLEKRSFRKRLPEVLQYGMPERTQVHAADAC